MQQCIEIINSQSCKLTLAFLLYVNRLVNYYMMLFLRYVVVVIKRLKDACHCLDTSAPQLRCVGAEVSVTRFTITVAEISVKLQLSSTK